MELFRLLGTIAIDNQKAIGALNETSEECQKTESKLSKAFGKIGSAAKKVGKVVAVGMTAASAAIVKIGKDAIASYADYEQLVGGVETLFKDSADIVMGYAQNAYKTAGLSANEYMETVTSFSASLLQSLDGDTKKAAESANLAITDMSDNANKMGSSMESIQNAYQGFAKQNYTMLDNLKLGYGGTKEEMERLLKDAEKLSGIKYDISSFDDIVQAIHVVQTEMGITGTTAKEAATTIQGSVASMKAAWQNLLTGMADENQNLDVLFGQFVDSVVTVGNNVIPRIQKLLPRIVEGVSALANQLAAHLPEIVESLLPSLLTGAISLVAALIKSIPSLALSIVKAFVQALQSLFQTVKDSGSEMLGSLASGIAENIPEMLKQAADIIIELVKGIVSNLPKIISAAGKIIASLVKGLAKGVSELFGVGKNLLNGLWKGFKSVWSSISGWVSEKVSWITDKFKAVSNFFSGIKDAVTGAASTKATTKTANVKAHASGAILKKPTIFGYTPSSGTYHLGGEAGAEAVAPIDKLMGYVRTAVAEQNNDSLLAEIRTLLERLLQAVQLGQGDTVIPVYIGTEKIDEIIMTAKQRMTNRSGGFANV